MSDPPTIPALRFTLIETVGLCLAGVQRALAEVRALARIPGPPGAKGEPGRNAGDLALLQEYIEQEVGVMLRAASVTTKDGGRTLLWSIGGKVHEVKTAIVLDAGVWKEGSAYSQGDGVTLGGNFYIAKTDTATKPPSDDWRLAVRAGRDGKDYRPEEKRAAEPVKFR